MGSNAHHTAVHRHKRWRLEKVTPAFYFFLTWFIFGSAPSAVSNPARRYYQLFKGDAHRRLEVVLVSAGLLATKCPCVFLDQLCVCVCTICKVECYYSELSL